MYILYIANKNYSSWSLRPWLLMRQLDIAFVETLVPFGSQSETGGFRSFSPTGKVPCLVDDETVIWDSLAITEYLAERHRSVWPKDNAARAWARCATAEMHSGFGVLRERCTMNVGIRVRIHDFPKELEAELARLNELWSSALSRFGGPYLAGPEFSAVDAFFAPVAFRLLSYGIQLGVASDAYAERLRRLPAMEQWYASALREPWRDPAHEAEAERAGERLEDLRS